MVDELTFYSIFFGAIGYALGFWTRVLLDVRTPRKNRVSNYVKNTSLNDYKSIKWKDLT